MRTRPFFNKSGYCSLLVFAAFFTMRATRIVETSEFSGGQVTGPILTMCDAAVAIFVVAAFVAFLRWRLAAAMTFVASFLALPFLICMLAPGPFRAIFPGNYSVPLRSNFAWQPESAISFLSLLMAVAFSCRIIWGNKAATSISAAR